VPQVHIARFVLLNYHDVAASADKAAAKQALAAVFEIITEARNRR
jgi:hypothetical protein